MGLIWDDYKYKEQRGKWNSLYSEQRKGKRERRKKLWPQNFLGWCYESKQNCVPPQGENWRYMSNKDVNWLNKWVRIKEDYLLVIIQAKS